MVQFAERLDRGFGAIADDTRRGVLERLGRGDASVTELAGAFDMTLTGMKKHIAVLEAAGLVRTAKVGRTRRCSLAPRPLEDENAWIERHRRMVEERMDRLEALLESQKHQDRKGGRAT